MHQRLLSQVSREVEGEGGGREGGKGEGGRGKEGGREGGGREGGILVCGASPIVNLLIYMF